MIPTSLKDKNRRIFKTIFETITYYVFHAVLFVSLGTFFLAGIFLLNPILFSQLTAYKSGPMPRSKDIEAVSGLYGPGAYIAWVLCTISAIINSSKSHSSKLSPDLIASFIYSTASTYWYYGRFIWFQPKGLDLLEDCSIQAGAFLFNVATLFHGLGIILTREAQNPPWVIITFLDIMHESLSPMVLGTEWLGLICLLLWWGFIFGMVFTPRHWWKLWMSLLIPPLHFILLEIPRTRHFTTSTFILPKTGSKITDLDQLVSLISGVTVVIYQWELWNLARIGRKLQTKFRQHLRQSDSIQMEANIRDSREPSDDHRDRGAP
ncbi:hypothetical protein CPB86DRAFT_800674 [Serendipita vermifera]|nr:hypothetical protein CPB86DRAFT_800674 [Serendipita vermifera]